MGADVLRQTGTVDRRFDGFVNDAGVNLPPGRSGTPRSGVRRGRGRRETAYRGNDEPYYSRHRGVLGVDGVVVQTEHLADVIEEFWWLTSRCVRHIRSPSWRPESADNR
jgi:hypothetical protein